LTLPIPKPGLVVRYGFLWSHEQRSGAVEAEKDRPCAIILAVRAAAGGAVKVTVAPITHTPPADESASIRLHPSVAKRLGLDSQPQWLRIDELNRFTWPGYDLRPRPDDPTRYEYGMLPGPLFETLRRAILARQQAKAAIRVAGRD